MKDPVHRIEQTLRFIRDTNIVTPQEKEDAYELARDFIRTDYPRRHGGRQTYRNFSLNMHLGTHQEEDPNRFRKMKRAAYLLAAAIRARVLNARIEVNAQAIPDHQAETVFRDVLRKARIVADQQHGRITGNVAALSYFSQHPRRFLDTNQVFVSGSPTRDNTQGDRNRLMFYFWYNALDNQYCFTPQPAYPGEAPRDVDSITAMKWADVPGSWNNMNPLTGSFQQIPAIKLSSSIAVTTQFTGCAFLMKRQGGNVYCAHLQPARTDQAAANNARILRGPELAREIAGQNHNVEHGDFENAPGPPPLSIYGVEFSSGLHQGWANGYPDNLGVWNASYMTVVGFRYGDDYQLYSQVNIGNQVQEARRIF